VATGSHQLPTVLVEGCFEGVCDLVRRVPFDLMAFHHMHQLSTGPSDSSRPSTSSGVRISLKPRRTRSWRMGATMSSEQAISYSCSVEFVA